VRPQPDGERRRAASEVRERILVREAVSGATHAEMQAAVARRDHPETCAAHHPRALTDGDRRERHVGHATVAAADGDHAADRRDGSGVDDVARARRANARAGRGGEVDAPVRSSRERVTRRVVESPHRLARNRS
jgi:hypothetical protein